MRMLSGRNRPEFLKGHARLEPSREPVQRLARRLFPGVQEAIVLEMLDRYGIEWYERERDRVQVAVLKLSNGDLERLKTMVSHAKMDYRDTLAAAESRVASNAHDLGCRNSERRMRPHPRMQP